MAKLNSKFYQITERQSYALLSRRENVGGWVASANMHMVKLSWENFLMDIILTAIQGKEKWKNQRNLIMTMIGMSLELQFQTTPNLIQTHLMVIIIIYFKEILTILTHPLKTTTIILPLWCDNLLTPIHHHLDLCSKTNMIQCTILHQSQTQMSAQWTCLQWQWHIHPHQWTPTSIINHNRITGTHP